MSSRMYTWCTSRILFSLLVSVVLTCPRLVRGQGAPDSLSLQGYVTDTSDEPITDPGASITFKLYDDGVEIWSETHSSVEIVDGVFNVLLGGQTPLDTVRFNRPLMLGIKIGTDSEISPRTPLAAAAYAKALPGLYTYYAEGGGDAGYNVVGGGTNNTLDANVVGATIGGGGGTAFGLDYPNHVIDDFGTISGGADNTVGRFAAVGGGASNVASNLYSIVAGGVGNEATFNHSTIGGGQANQASGSYSTVGGGILNHADGHYSTVPGGYRNAARGEYSFAAGFNARPHHDGSFVWGDRSTESAADSFITTGVNQFLIRAEGGVGIGTNSPDAPLDLAGGNNWDLASTEGDFRIGNDTYRLKMGVALAGGGAGTSRIHAEGGSGRIVLGGNDTDVIRFDPTTGVYPGSDNTFPLGTSGNKWTEVWATDGTINTSDWRLKTDVADIEYGIEAVEQLHPVHYRWKDRPEAGYRLGLIAQEAEEVVPEVVEHPKEEDGYLGMRYAELVPVLVKAIQEQQEEIEELRRALDLAVNNE